MAALGGIGKKQKYGYAPANYSRGTGGGMRPIKDQSTIPTQMTDLAFNKTLDMRLRDYEKIQQGNLRAMEKDFRSEMKDLNRDTIKLNQFRDTSKETISDLNKRVKEAEKEIENNLGLVSSFSFTKEQSALSDIIKDTSVPLKERKLAMKQLGSLVNKDFDAIRKGGLYDNTPNGGTLHNIEDGKPPNEKIKEQDEEILPDAFEPPKPAFSVDEAEKQKEAGEAAVREQREAEEGDTTMAEPEPEAPAEVFSVDGSEQLQRAAEAETQAQRDAEAEDETMEEPRVVGTVPPMEVFKDQPGDFPEQDVTSQPGKGIK
jgi:hypothetical protein